MGAKYDLKKYEDFTGTLIKVKKVFFSQSRHYLYLQNKDKKIKVICGSVGCYIVGQKIKIGHIGKQIINIRPLSHSPYSRVTNKERYYCKLYRREVNADECGNAQEILRKPEEAETLPFNLDDAHLCCPKCPYNQRR